ncbi:hypothetical protein HDU76_011645, partial [Blyttiomyces sp. JEL0837]
MGSIMRRIPASASRHGSTGSVSYTSPKSLSPSRVLSASSLVDDHNVVMSPSSSTTSLLSHQNINGTISMSRGSSRRTSTSISSSSLSSEVKETPSLVKNVDPATGNKMINKYMVVREIGRGCHGKVKLCVDVETGESYAIKIVEKHARRRFQSRFALSQRLAANNGGDSSSSAITNGEAMNPQLEKIKKEIAILKKVNHPNVVGLHEVIDDPQAEKIYLVLEYMAGGEVKWRDRSDPPKPTLTLNEARSILRDVVCGLEYLHHQGIVHRDIKPANLLWTADRRVKISDFGVSVFVGNSSNQQHQNLLQDGSIDGSGYNSANAGFSTSLTNDSQMSRDSTGSRPDGLMTRIVVTQQKEELELAKTAGSPAFFAPELCAVFDDEFDDEIGGDVHETPGVATVGSGSDTTVVGEATTRGRSVGQVESGGVKMLRARSTPRAASMTRSPSNPISRMLSQSQSGPGANFGGGNEENKMHPPTSITDLFTESPSTYPSSPVATRSGLTKLFANQSESESPTPDASKADDPSTNNTNTLQVTSPVNMSRTISSPAKGSGSGFPIRRRTVHTDAPSFFVVPASYPPPPNLPNGIAATGGSNNNGASIAGSPSSNSISLTPMERYRKRYRQLQLQGAVGDDGIPVLDELGASRESAMEMGAAIDVWALGVTLFCLVFGQVPFKAETEFELFHVICKQPLEIPDEPPIDDLLYDLLSRLLEKDPQRRITLSEVKLHPWTTEDLSPQERVQWLQETDPTLQFGTPLSVTDEEVSTAVRVVLMDRIRDSFRKFGTGLQNLVGFKRRTKSYPSVMQDGEVGMEGAGSPSTPEPPLPPVPALPANMSRVPSSAPNLPPLSPLSPLSPLARQGGDASATSPNQNAQVMSPDAMSPPASLPTSLSAPQLSPDGVASPPVLMVWSRGKPRAAGGSESDGQHHHHETQLQHQHHQYHQPHHNHPFWSQGRRSLHESALPSAATTDGDAGSGPSAGKHGGKHRSTLAWTSSLSAPLLTDIVTEDERERGNEGGESTITEGTTGTGQSPTGGAKTLDRHMAGRRMPIPAFSFLGADADSKGGDGVDGGVSGGEAEDERSAVEGDHASGTVNEEKRRRWLGNRAKASPSPQVDHVGGDGNISGDADATRSSLNANGTNTDLTLVESGSGSMFGVRRAVLRVGGGPDDETEGSESEMGMFVRKSGTGSGGGNEGGSLGGN